jgi:diguanylate cyclase (GGDEF)-like protein
VDHFKRFNDRYGHDAGDQALRMVAAELARVGKGGKAYRYGGEEFSVVFNGRSADEANAALEQVRSSIESKRFAIRAPDRPKRKPKQPQSASTEKLVTLTVSMGVAFPSSRRPTPAEVLKAADQALYKAKRGGRNRIVAA